MLQCFPKELTVHQQLRRVESMGKKRNLGLDLSRVIAMVFVVAVHVVDGLFNMMPDKETGTVFMAEDASYDFVGVAGVFGRG